MSSGGQEQAIQRADVVHAATRFLPPPLLLLLSILSVQLGAAIAKSLFHTLSFEGIVFLRVGFAAIIYLVMARPRLRGYTWRNYLVVVLFGLVIAGMNTLYYASISRIPLGVATTLEFVGPLGVSLFGSRRLIDLLWVVLAAAGIVLLAPIGGGAALDPLGVVLALSAGAGWAAYILVNVRVGQAFPGTVGLALSMSVAAIVLAPFDAGYLFPLVNNPVVLLLGLGVAILSTVIPFALELEALRRISARVFGILMSLEPAVSALVGLIVLGEIVSLRALIAMGLIIVASCGVSFAQNNHK
ncbi:EamA family transporter [Ktedonosporobacter rubrisoli]|uniref:EamA family transporter n=2 Tax=Ktedonosporobacter rubrisoli TaxID=2509675 RepID=A0A4P6K4Z2_KTERU|nr:EamA family transporter [Ktedonosporobacter rubrisoli]